MNICYFLSYSKVSCNFHIWLLVFCFLLFLQEQVHIVSILVNLFSEKAHFVSDSLPFPLCLSGFTSKMEMVVLSKRPRASYDIWHRLLNYELFSSYDIYTSVQIFTSKSCLAKLMYFVFSTTICLLFICDFKISLFKGSIFIYLFILSIVCWDNWNLKFRLCFEQ